MMMTMMMKLGQCSSKTVVMMVMPMLMMSDMVMMTVMMINA